MIYFDYNATSPLRPGVLEAMEPYYRGFYGNPSSLHRIGRISRDAVEKARDQIASLAGASPGQVVFTSGGTEANNLAIRGLADSLPPGTILFSPIEHPSVIEPINALAKKGWIAQPLRVDEQGLVRTEVLDASIAPDVRFASCMLANNETGVIQNFRSIAPFFKERNIPFHTDGVQAFGKISVHFDSLGANFMSLSAHKIGGPKGVGALIVDKSVHIEPLLRGGGQEKRLRAGTENVAAIVGFGVAAEIALRDLEKNARHLATLVRELERGLKKLPGASIFSESAEKLPNTLMFGIQGIDGEMLVMELDRKGIAVSSGSACSSQNSEPSHVLLAMGVSDDLARCAVRVSLGPENTAAEVEVFLEVVSRIIGVQPVRGAVF